MIKTIKGSFRAKTASFIIKISIKENLSRNMYPLFKVATESEEGNCDDLS